MQPLPITEDSKVTGLFFEKKKIENHSFFIRRSLSLSLFLSHFIKQRSLSVSEWNVSKF